MESWGFLVSIIICYLVDYDNKKAVIEVAEIIGLKKVSEKIKN